MRLDPRIASHLGKGQEFLDAAELSLDVGLLDAAASNAVTAGINAKDAICLVANGTTRKADNHQEALKELRGVSLIGNRLHNPFKRLLALKSRSQYSSTTTTRRQAADAVRWATTMLDEARDYCKASREG